MRYRLALRPDDSRKRTHHETLIRRQINTSAIRYRQCHRHPLQNVTRGSPARCIPAPVRSHDREQRSASRPGIPQVGWNSFCPLDRDYPGEAPHQSACHPRPAIRGEAPGLRASSLRVGCSAPLRSAIAIVSWPPARPPAGRAWRRDRRTPGQTPDRIAEGARG